MVGPLQYISLDEFYFKWRFAEDASKWTVLPDEDLANVHPLDEECARILWKRFVHPIQTQLIGFAKEWGWKLRDDTPLLKTADFSTALEERECVSRFLRQHIDIVDRSQLIFFWDAECAVETTWDVLLRYWDDFCYPSDESNVAVAVESSKNAYYYEELLWIEPRRAATRTEIP
jgi:hypothetical protein